MSIKRAYNVLAFATGHCVLAGILAAGVAVAGIVIADRLCKKKDYEDDLDDSFDDAVDDIQAEDNDAAFYDEVLPDEEVPCCDEPDDSADGEVK